MPTRGKRSLKQTPKYKDSDESEGDGDFEDSGSEASIHDADCDDESDSSVDEFEEEEVTTKTKTKTPQRKSAVPKIIPVKSKISMATLKRNLQSAGAKINTSGDSPTDPEVPFSIKDLTDTEKLLPSFLNLSESDSDGSDNETKDKSSPVNPLEYKTFIQKNKHVEDIKIKVEKPDGASNQPGRLSDSGTDSEMEDVNSELQASNDDSQGTSKKLNFQYLTDHAKKLAEAKQSLESYNKRHSGPTRQEETLRIDELLAIGETDKVEEKISSGQDDTSDSDVEDLEEVKGESKSNIPKGGIQLILDLPTDRPKAKNKQLDLEMMLKRRMNRVKKEYQVFTHKVHVLCWLGHGNFVNKTINDQSIMAAALSLIPSEQCYPENRIDIKYVEQITKWYNGAMNLKEDKAELKYKPNKRPLSLALLQQIDKKTATTKKNLALIFASMLRALGIKCRIVFSFRVVPLRPPDTELCSLSIKNREPSSKKIGKEGETSKHFKTTPSTSTSKNDKTKITTESKSDKSKTKSAQPKKVSGKTCKSDTLQNIPQLDGADDRDLSTSGTRTSRVRNKNKPLTLSKKNASNASESNLKSPTPSGSNLSYWDELMKNSECEMPAVEKRVSHRSLQLKSPSQDVFKSKVKTEVFSPISSIFNESTVSIGNAPFVENENILVNAIKKEKNIVFSKVLKNILPSALESPKNLSSSKASTSQNGTKESTSQKGRKSTLQKKTVDSDKKSIQKLKKSDELSLSKKLLLLPLPSKGSNIIEPNPTNGRKQSQSSNSETVLVTKKSRTTKGPDSGLTKEIQEVTTRPNSRSSQRLKASSKEATALPKPTASKKTTATNEVTSSKKNPSLSREIVSSTSSRRTAAPVEKKKSAVVPPSKTSSIEKHPPKPVSQAKNTQRRAKSVIPQEVSKYFSSPDSSDNRIGQKNQRKSCDKRVSHRDLLNKSLPSGSGSSVKKVADVTKDLVSLVKDRIRESKAQARSKLVKGKIKVISDDDSDYVEEVVPQARAGRDSRSSDADFKPSKKRPPATLKTIKDRRVLSTDDEQSVDGAKRKGVNVWCEVFVEEEEQWIAVDVVKAQVHCGREIYSRATHPVTYIVAWDSEGHVKDVTRRYVPHWNTATRKLRVNPSWYDEAMKPWSAPPSLREKQEDKQLDRMQLDAPLPQSIVEYKNHPLYALKRHLLKFEVIYPPDAVTLGFVKKEAVYARECVHVCHSREMWVKEAKVVRAGESPYKIVKARPKWDRSTNTVIKDIPLEIFGPWQVDDYVPPQAENGLVPRNPYGNVELFKKCMLPKGTVHLQLPSLNKVARKLGIDCAPAMTGFDFHSGWSHPVYDGFVVCEEFKDQIVAAWEQEQEEAEQRAREKIEKRVYGNWKRLIRGLFIRERLKRKYDFQNEDPFEQAGGSNANKKRSKGPRFLAKKRRSCERSSGSDSS